MKYVALMFVLVTFAACAPTPNPSRLEAKGTPGFETIRVVVKEVKFGHGVFRVYEDRRVREAR